ncbi:MAG TPA: hypothetical protein DHW83_01915 [Bacteroidales bacterium]|nr:hypothetical protein [Bacteroidales bacterium]
MENEKLNELEKVIMRDDYKRLSTQLAEKCEELSDIILEKMIELDLYELDDLIIEEEHSYHGFKVEYLVIKKVNKNKYGNYYNSGSLNNCKASHDSTGYYFDNDFRCWIKYASNDEALYFLNNIKKYLNLLSNIEDEKCNEIEKVLNNI